MLAVASIAAMPGLWIVPASVAAGTTVRVRETRRLRAITARRCAAVAGLERLSPSLGEDIVLGDLAAIACSPSVLDDAATVISEIHDPWRRLLAEHRLSIARDRIRPGGLIPARLLYALAATSMAAGTLGFVVTGSPWWSLGSIAGAVPASLAVAETRWRRRVMLVVAARAAADPIGGEPPTEEDLVAILRSMAAGDAATLGHAARHAASGDVAIGRLTTAAARCPS